MWSYVFNVWAWVNGDDIAMLHAEVVSDNTVNTNTAVVKVVVCKDDENGVLPLLALNQDCVTTEKLKSLHGVVRKGDNRVVVVNGIGHAVGVSNGVLLAKVRGKSTHINEFGFFFFLRIAVAVSNSWKSISDKSTVCFSGDASTHILGFGTGGVTTGECCQHENDAATTSVHKTYLRLTLPLE